MKKNTKILGTFLCILIISPVVSENVHDKMDWMIVKQIEFPIQPIDVAMSEDGKWIFINGRFLGKRDLSGFSEMIEAELKRKD